MVRPLLAIIRSPGVAINPMRFIGAFHEQGIAKRAPIRLRPAASGCGIAGNHYRVIRPRADAVVCASGSALTHAGMLVGLRALGERAPVLGICVRRDAASQGRVLFRT